ncbi:hypothetical protein [Egicoccus halophilus]|uniref:Uncharacterized protein n=1 Tax=Egicoccus halophilus TaxID=1670830 RepID=A0A8J3ACW8_9ACTN|nr:hypothetical protein [Egicoccus halophilus]GGI08853.1 hypothetical protein GCM10011354_31160 [Egicoccus halophilus]
MEAPAAILALVLAMTAVGGSALVWFFPTWGAVRHGYEVLSAALVALLAWGAWGSLRAPVRTLESTASASDGQLALTLLLVLAIASGLAALLLVVPAPAVLARLVGGAGTLAGLASFVPLAAIRAARDGAGGLPQGVAELLLGSLLLGGIWAGMVLGHWYLVERRLTNRYMVVMAWTNIAAVVAGLVSVLLSGRNPAPCEDLTGAAFQACAQTFSPILRIGSMTLTLGIGVLALIALIAGFNLKLAREGGRSIQASTGMYYLAVILAPAAEFAAKVRFF